MATKTEAVRRIKLSKLARSRAARELSRGDLAKKTKLSVHQVWSAEKGAGVTPEVAQRLAAGLGLKLTSLR